MVMVDRDGKIVLVNREIERLFGYPREELLGQPIERLVPFAARDRHPQLRSDFNAAPQSRAMGAGRDLFGRHKDGTEVPVEIGLNPIEDDEGAFVLASVVDISARTQAEERLRETSERYHRTLDNMMEGCQIIGPGGRYLFVNSAAARHGRQSRDALLGHTMEELYPGIERGEVFAAIRRCMEEHVPIQMESHFRYPDGTTAWFDLRMHPVPEGVFILSIDVTERKRTEEELRRSNEELQRFAYVASHDLQEPLRMVGNYVQLLARRYKGRLDADADDFIAFALEGAVRMQRLIEDLLAFSRVGTRGGELRPTDVNAVLADALARLQLTIDETHATVTFDELPVVPADPGQLERVFLNLIGNALKFRGSARPSVHVSATPGDGAWLFRVRDNGIGIEPEYFDRIFVIFQRLHARDEYPGTGIGLAITKRVIERHGGRIWVESRPGEGSTFCFSLPAAGGST